MDAIFKSDDNPYISPPINLKKFLAVAFSCEESLNKFFEIRDPNNTKKTEIDITAASTSLHNKDNDNATEQNARDKFSSVMEKYGCTRDIAKNIIKNSEYDLLFNFHIFIITNRAIVA